MATAMENIRPDHRARYIFASSYIKPGDMVLDAICGIGYGTKLMSQLSTATFLAFDRNEEAIQVAKSFYRASNANFLSTDFENFTYSEDAFDLITCFEAIEHVLDDEKLLLKLNLLLKPQGLLLISTPNEKVMPWSMDKFPEHIQHYLPIELDVMLNNAGFTVESWHCQRDKYSFKIHDGSEGNFMIAVCRKI